MYGEKCNQHSQEKQEKDTSGWNVINPGEGQAIEIEEQPYGGGNEVDHREVSAS